jgi:hypothetical protein
MPDGTGRGALVEGEGSVNVAKSSDQGRGESVVTCENVPSSESSEPARGESAKADGERLKGFSVVLITLLAALGAIVTWRAEVAASSAAGLTQRGVVVLINLTAERAKDQATALSEEADVMRVQQLLDERDLLDNQLSVTTAGEGQEELAMQYKVQFWVAEWRLRNTWAANFYLQNAATAPTYDVARRTADLVAESRMPTDSASWFAQADKEQRKRRYLLLLDIALVIGLSCATAAQFTRRRAQLLCTSSGAAVFVLGIIVIWIVEA